MKRNMFVILCCLILALAVMLSSCVSQQENQEVAAGSGSSTVVVETGAQGRDARSWTVTVENGAVNPSDLVIAVGDTVEWVNADSESHNIAFEDARLDETLSSGGSLTHTFTEAGTFRYFDQFTGNPAMQGSVIVE